MNWAPFCILFKLNHCNNPNYRIPQLDLLDYQFTCLPSLRIVNQWLLKLQMKALSSLKYNKFLIVKNSNWKTCKFEESHFWSETHQQNCRTLSLNNWISKVSISQKSILSMPYITNFDFSAIVDKTFLVKTNFWGTRGYRSLSTKYRGIKTLLHFLIQFICGKTRHREEFTSQHKNPIFSGCR